MNYSELLQLAKGWGNFKFYRGIIWRLLIICGHVHGGQVVFPFIGGLYGGDQEWFPKYVHGLYKKDNFQMFITSGLGSNKQKLPRINNPPEIAVLNIEI